MIASQQAMGSDGSTGSRTYASLPSSSSSTMVSSGGGSAWSAGWFVAGAHAVASRVRTNVGHAPG
ncbi:hypothetical protein [Nonomuraea sp. NPDC049141]|uniref:hypothetical protein n=1 Tax=Nonomuraea sp. NPDC049141 TaxID=3155500 RepID=UPI0033E4039D